MIRIRQHGEDGNLFDIKCFLEDIDSYFDIDSWFINIDWCQGEKEREIEQESKGGKLYSDASFRKLYGGIFQTIDGTFELKSSDVIVVKLLADDSTYWEVESINKDFETHMLKKYGEYKIA